MASGYWLIPEDVFQRFFESGQFEYPDQVSHEFSFFQDPADALAVFPDETDCRFDIVKKEFIR